jgi:polyphosphate kinase
LVRAICCLRPGVKGLSDNIRVRSLVGRWLEHSRIYYFGDDSADGPSGLDGGEYYVGSADMMERNLDRRVEAIVPVSTPDLQSRLKEILEIEMSDDQRAWELAPDGIWTRVPVVKGINAQQRLQDLAYARSKPWRDADGPHGGSLV